MSSHHVVREAQEPALLVLHPQSLHAPHISPLLEWSPTIVVMGEVLQEVVASGIKIDAAVFQSVQIDEVKELLQDQMPVSLLPLAAGETPLLKAVAWLAEKGHGAANVLTSGIGDVRLAEELAAQQDIENVVLLNSEEKSVLIRTGKFFKWFPAGEIVEIWPAAHKLMLSTRGFAKDLTRAEVYKPQEFRINQAGTISIEADGPFWLKERLT